MLLPRIIPCLLVHDGGLVKTVRFASPKYVGDPINAVRIFNEKRVDELVVLDIDASVRGREPDFEMIGHLAAECRMPLCYGGGVKTVAQAERIVSIGVEKVAMSSAAVDDPDLLGAIAEIVGSQSVVVVIDVKKAGRGKYEAWLDNGTRATGLDAVELARKVEGLGVGEVVINSIDNDGLMKGYDLDLVEAIRGAINIPMTVLGGAGSLQDIKTLLDRFGIIGAAAGSLFVFKGAYRAVLINYPNPSEKQRLLA
jgi:cyclase